MRLPVALIERLKRVAKDGAGRPLYLTLAKVVEDSLNSHLTRVEQVLDASIVDPATPPTHARHPVRRTTTLNNAETCGPLRR